MQPNAPQRPIRIVLADDHAMLRAAFTLLVEQLPGAEVIAEAGDGEELIRVAEALEPEIVFVDIEMPKMDGLEAIRRLAQSRPNVRCVVLSMHESVEMVRRAAACGAAGYVMKNASAQELHSAIDAVMARGSYYSPAVASLLLAPVPPGPQEVLTERQVEIVKLMASGKTSKEIAYELGLSPKTVDAHRARIMERLQIFDLASLTHYAIRHRLVEL